MLVTLALLTLLAGPQVPPQEDGTLESLSRAFSAYFKARERGDGVEGAHKFLQASLHETFPGGSPLRNVDAIERALQLSRAHSLGKVRKGKITEDVYVGGAFQGLGLSYAYRVPKDYQPKVELYPLILAIPDQGESPAHHLRDSWSSREVQERAIVVVIEMPADPGKWDKVMVNGLPGGLCHVLTGARIATERFAANPNRVFVAGRGKGVLAAMAAGNTQPQRFAGIVGRAGDAAELEPDNFGTLPVFLAGGGARATAFVKAAVAEGLEHCTLSADTSELKAWTWMAEQRRNVAPRRIVLAVGEPFPVRSGWLRAMPSEVRPQLTASLDARTNTVRLEARGASRVVFYLNDRMLDLDRPLKIIAGPKKGTARVRRNLALTLDRLVDGTSDTGCLYTAELVIDLGPGPLWPEAPRPPRDKSFEARLTAAEGSVDALWKLHEWCLGNSRVPESVTTLKSLLRLDPDHREARSALGHRWSPVQWFTSQAALDTFNGTQDAQWAAESGWVKYQSSWMHTDERSRLSKGMQKNYETGEWVSGAERKLLDQGWKRQDLQWIEPQEALHLDQGLWRVDGEWVDLAAADRRRAVIGSMWCIPGAQVRLHTTCDREVALLARAHMERAIGDMRKVFGAVPPLPLDVTLLRIEEQFDRFAFGETDGRRPPSHVGRLHLIHNGYFAESWFPAEGGSPSYRGMGVGLWDKDYPNGDAYGVHSARVALGLSYMDALDPSPKAHRTYPDIDYYAEFEAEKRLPQWLRWGGPVYAERFFEDTAVPPGGDPWWARSWSIENLERLGGLRPVAEIMAFEIDPDQREDAQRFLIEAGLLVAFMVDGDHEPVAIAHADFKHALAAGRLRRSHLERLAEALTQGETALIAFASLDAR
jgi:hypothetical protein